MRGCKSRAIWSNDEDRARALPRETAEVCSWEESLPRGYFLTFLDTLEPPKAACVVSEALRKAQSLSPGTRVFRCYRKVAEPQSSEKRSSTRGLGELSLLPPAALESECSEHLGPELRGSFIFTLALLQSARADLQASEVATGSYRS